MNTESVPVAGRSVRCVVLVTDDRNLRVKALAADLPARDLPSFVRWAGLAPHAVSTDCPLLNMGPINYSRASIIEIIRRDVSNIVFFRFG